MTPEERRIRKNESNRLSRLRRAGHSVPYKRKGRPWINAAVRCPECGATISAMKDCDCP